MTAAGTDPAPALPPVTVLLPVRDGLPHLRDAVASVLAQTHRDLELLVLDDGSTDGTGAWLDGLRDSRVRVLHREGRGLVAALNDGLGEARHELVARMDADDLSAPDRLERQCAHLLAHPHVAAAGSCFHVIDEEGAVVGEAHTAAHTAYLRRLMYARNDFAHGSMMLRRSAVLAVGGYRDVGPCEDYDLWVRLLSGYDLANLPDLLYSYRLSETGVSALAAGRQVASLHAVRHRLHGELPLPRPRPLDLAREGVAHVRSHPACRRTARTYAHDHAVLAGVLAREGRWAAAAATAAGLALFVLRTPVGVLGVPPLDRLPAALGRLRAR